MKPTFAPLLLIASLPLAAQTAAQTTAPAAKPPVHHTTATTATTTSAAAHAAPCAKLPEISPKVPPTPAGLPCAKPLLVITQTPPAHLDYVSPLVTPEVRDGIGLSPVTFSLSYLDTKVGTGELALPRKYYTVHYTGYLTDGTKFDSSLDRGEPISFPIGAHQVIAGWDLGMQGMHIGGKRRLYIPWQLAYGDRGKSPIPARADLIFDIELISQSDSNPKPPPAPEAPPASKTPPSDATPPQGNPSSQPAKPATPPASATPPPASATPPPASTPPPTPKL